MYQLKSLFPTAALVESTPLIELCGGVLQVLNRRLQEPNGAECAHNFLLGVRNEYDQHAGVSQAFSEAWGWLYSNGFICQHPNNGDNWMTLTRMGRKAATQSSFAAWVADRELAQEMLHPALRTTALSLFRQSLFDTAVFEAFKLLEVSIRSAAGLGDDLIGTKLAARAFNPENGELTDKNAEAGERQALMNLMSGAIGSYKNPQSHRHVGLDASEAREMILMASHLIKIVESRRQP